MKSVFITGATGFVGQRLVAAIQEQVDSVRILSRKGQIGRDTVVCNLESETIPHDALIGVDVVFHLAGFAHDLSNENKVQELYHKVNVEATVRLAQLAVTSSVKSFVFVSSVKAGGLPFGEKCTDEEMQHEPDGIYGKTKREAELELLRISETSDMHVSIIRPSLVYGPGVKGNLHLMLSGIEKGWFPPLPDTGNKRSMIHVDDLVRAILLVISDDRANREIFIATDGRPYSSKDIYSTMCYILGKPVPRWSVPKLFFDIASLLGPHIQHKLEKLLGNECYSSAKLEKLGFRAERSLKNMNETVF